MTIESTNDDSESKRPQFSLKSLLLLAGAIACCVGAYHCGHQVGYDKGDRSGYATGINEKFYLVSYRVADMIGPTRSFANFDAIKKEITSKIRPDSWSEDIGRGMLAEDKASGNLIISHTERCHDEIADFLETVRAEQGTVNAMQTGVAKPK